MRSAAPASVRSLADGPELSLLEARIDTYLSTGHPRRQELVEMTERHAALAWEKAVREGPIEHGSTALGWAERIMPHPIFILGAHRSGTTLVRNLLDGHPELSVLPSEGNLLTHFHRRFRGMGQADRAAALARIWIARFVLSEGVPPFWLLGRSGSNASPYVDFAQRVAAWTRSPRVIELRAPYDAFLPVVLAFTESTRTGREREAIRYWAEKSPLHELHLKSSLRRFPDARCVHVIRDPRATLVSRRMLDGSAGIGGSENIRRYARLIARSLKLALRHQKRLGAAKYHVLRYEDLLSDPGATVTRLREFLALRDHATLYRPTVTGKATRPNSSYAPPSDLRELASSSLERFRTQLTDRESAIIRPLAGRAAAAFGYDLDR